MAARGGIKGRKLGPHTAKRLVPVDLGRLKKPGMYADGKGLYFKVSATGGRSWIFRFRAVANVTIWA